MRRFLVVGLLAALALSFVVRPAGAQEPTVVRYWYTISDRETATLPGLIAEFEAEHPDIRIAARPFAYNDFREALLRSIVSGDSPDVARLDVLWVPEFADMGVLDPLDVVMPDFDKIVQKFFPGPLQTGYWQGHTWGLPLNTDTQVLLYNREQFNAAGLEAPDTIDQFVEAACALTDGTRRFGYALEGTYFWAMAPLFYAQGGQVTDAEGTTADGYLNGERSIQAFQTLVDLYQKGCLAPKLLGGGTGTKQGHSTGLYSMIVASPSIFESYRDDFPQFEPSFALVPAGAGGTTSVVGGEDVVLLTDSKVKAAALAWMGYLAGDRYQLAMARVGVLPTVKTLAGNAALPDYFAVFMRQLETAQARTPNLHWTEMGDILDRAFQAMLRADKPVKQALDEAAAEIDDLLAD